MNSDRVVLVTGGSGVVGSAIVPLLLSEPKTRVYLLLRARSDFELGSRVDSLAAHWGDSVTQDALAARLRAIKGDVLKDRLGLQPSDFERLRERVTHIVHSAGNVKLNQPIDTARASAVGAMESILAFARACNASRTAPKIEYLSTVGVAGRRPGLIPEAPLSGRFGYHNTYEQAKAEAEAIALREATSGQPLTVHRPSMVVGDSRSGRIVHFQVFYYLIRFLAGMRTRGILPQFGDAKLDLVPVDYVARAVVASSWRPDWHGRILHLCSGPPEATPLATLAGLLRAFLGERGERVPSPRFVPRTLLRTGVRVVSSLAPARTRKGFESLPFFLDYLDEAQVFANATTTTCLREQGVEVSPVSDFLGPVLDYWYQVTRTRESRV